MQDADDQHPRPFLDIDDHMRLVAVDNASESRDPDGAEHDRAEEA